MLSVESDRLPKWHRPGLLMIGDAAHVMSPVAGVGINYAIQDAVVAANVLGEPLSEGRSRYARTGPRSTPPGMADAYHPGPANADAA